MTGTIRFGRAVAAGIAGTIGREATSAILGRWIAGPFFNPNYQSPEFLQTLTRLQQRQLSVPRLVFMHLLLSVLHGLVFSILCPYLGATKLRPGFAFGALVWVFSDLYFDLLVPWNWFHGPTLLMLLDLFGFWIPATVAEGLVISFVHGHHNRLDG